MNCRNILVILTALLLTLSARAFPPKVVLILADDLGYGDMGCHGATKLKTPSIDRLATNEMRFLNAYAPSPVCFPSRYALMTGI
jgi:arylsulfatase A